MDDIRDTTCEFVVKISIFYWGDTCVCRVLLFYWTVKHHGEVRKTVCFKQRSLQVVRPPKAYLWDSYRDPLHVPNGWALGCHFFATPVGFFQHHPLGRVLVPSIYAYSYGNPSTAIHIFRSKKTRRNYIWKVDGRVIYLLSALPSIWSLNSPFQKQSNAHNNPHTVDLWCFTGIWINPVLLVLFWQGESQWITMTAATNISQILWVLPKPCNSSVHEDQ